jgi:AraC family transcriptional regulator
MDARVCWSRRRERVFSPGEYPRRRVNASFSIPMFFHRRRGKEAILAWPAMRPSCGKTGDYRETSAPAGNAETLDPATTTDYRENHVPRRWLSDRSGAGERRRGTLSNRESDGVKMIEWIPGTTLSPCAGGETRWNEALSSGESWAGLRLEEGEAAPGGLPEGRSRCHLVGIHQGAPARHERDVPGQRCRTKTVVKEDITIWPAGLTFRGRLLDPVACLVVQIEPEFVASAGGNEAFVDRFELAPACCVRDSLVAQLLYALRRDVRAGTPCGRLYGESLGTSLVAHLLCRYAVRHSVQLAPRHGLGANRLRRVVEYVNDRLETDLSLRELAAVVGLSCDHFARGFKHATGLSVHRYVVSRRIERARRLLRDPGIPIVEVAARCGFAGQSSFTTTFRRVAGITPRAYREGHREQPA